MPGRMDSENRDIWVQTVPNIPAEPGDFHWRVIGQSIQGSSHIQNELDNQDAIGWLPGAGTGRRVALSVADGHGSPKNFRSKVGARLAVEVSLGIASELLDVPDEVAPDGMRLLSFVKDRLEQDVPRRVVREWLRHVDQHVSRSPFTDWELDGLEARDGRASRDLVAGNPRLAYGSTLVTAIAMESFMAFWQIGDGDVLTVSAGGNVSRPVPGDDRLMANETTSLCSSDAARQFRVAVLGTPVPMVMVSTDGFSNSFQDDEGMFKFGSDVGKMINEQGLDSIADSLENWLTEITSRGSGDDISLGIICRPAMLDPERNRAGRRPPPGNRPHPPRAPRRDPSGPPNDTGPQPGPEIVGNDHGTLILPHPDFGGRDPADLDMTVPDPGKGAPAGLPEADSPQAGQGGKRSSWWWPPAWWRRWQQWRARRTSQSSEMQPDEQTDKAPETS